MPSLEQLPEAAVANPTDMLLLDQSGTSTSITVEVLQAGLQPKQTLASGNLLGRASPGPGQPEPIGLGAGVTLNAGVLIADTTVVAPLASPGLTGVPTAPTPPIGDSSNRIATTAFVQAKITSPVTLVGDVTSTGESSNGAVIATLPSITTPGTYASVVVNAKGQVTYGTSLPTGGAVEVQSNKGVSNGYAGLDSTGKVPVAQLPTSALGGGVSSVAGQTGAVTASEIASALSLSALATASPSSVSISGGTVDGTVLGGTTPASGKFTSLTATSSATVPTVVMTDNSGNAASTAFVKSQGYITSSNAPVLSVAGKTGAITLSASDVAGALSAASPALTGTPTGPTASVNTNTSQLATTAFVLGQAANSAPLADGVAAIGTTTQFARQDHIHPTDTSRAPLVSPALTGTPTAPTASSGDSSNTIATTAFVKAQNYITSGTAPVQSVSGRIGAIVLGVADVGGAAPLASPALTGTPTAPTPSTTDNSTKVATTAFVQSQSYLTAGTAPVSSVAGKTGVVTDLSAANVTATGSATGNTLAMRFSHVADIYDYGATGNGTTDDTAAFNAAVATGKPIFFDSGAYKLTASSMSGMPGLVSGMNASLTLNGWPGLTNQAYWNGHSGYFFTQYQSGTTGQATVVITSLNNQPAGNIGESGALYVSTLTEAPGANSAGIAIIAQASAAVGNNTATLCGINSYAIWPSSSQGSGSTQEVDVQNYTGTDDSWPPNNATAKVGMLIVSQGPNKPTAALNIEASGAQFQAGAIFGHSATSQYDLYGGGASTSTPRWYIDSIGNITGQTVYGQTLEVGTFSSAPAATITTGTLAPTASAMPGSLYLDGNQSLPGPGALYVNTTTGISPGTSWGQVAITNQSTTFSASLKANILAGSVNVLDDGAGNATIYGGLFAKNGVDLLGSASGGTTLSAPSTGSSITWTVPGIAPSAGQFLLASGVSGNSVTLGWSSASGGSVSAGSAGQLAQYASGGTTLSGLTTGSGVVTALAATPTGSGSLVLSSNPAITGGSINGMTVGASTPASGAFTTLSASGLASFAGGIADASYSSQSPATGFSITVANGVSTLQLTPASTLASGTITMPSSPANGQWLVVASTQTISALTFSPASGQTILNAPIILPSGVEVAFQYQTGGSRWICQSGNDARVVSSGTAGALTFGTGADGPITVSSGTTTLSRDMHWSNCTISGTGSINTNGWRMFVSGILDISAAQTAAITANGVNGNGATGSSGAFPPSGIAMRTVGQSPITGGAGGAGSTSTGATGTAGAANLYGNGGNGGAGGSGGTSTGAGGGAGIGGNQTIQIPLNTPTTFFFPPGIGASLAAGLIGGGGGGGGGDGTNAGGGGGAGGSFGGTIALYARNIQRGSNTNSSIIQAKGGAGGAGGNAAGGNAAGGGGGGGGGGGCVYLINESLLGSSISNCLDASGGNGGVGGTGAGTGKGGGGGSGGASGSIQVVNLITPSYSGSAWNTSGISGGTTSTTSGGAAGAGSSLRVTL